MIEIKAGDYIVHVTNDGECVNERPLIHCAECMHGRRWQDTEWYDCMADNKRLMKADGFCSWAEMPHGEAKS